MRGHNGLERGVGERLLDPRELLGWSLPETAREAPTLGGLAERLRTSRVDLGLLEPHIRFDSERYVRVPLARTDACELLLVCWLPGQASRVHDHGGSAGASLLLRGDLQETRYVWAGDRLVQELSARASEGDLLLERGETIHRVVNPSRIGAVSLHLYMPPMEDMTHYDAWAEHAPDARVLRPPRPPGAAGVGRRRRPRAT